MKKIFYISYWGVKEGLSVSTVYPNLRILSGMEGVERVDYFTVERASDKLFKDSLPPMPKITHHPIISKDYKISLLTKIADWQRIRKTILQKAKEIKPDFVICRTAMAGAFGTMLFEKMGIPYAVESFEPHAAYMEESGVWKKGGLRHRFQLQKEKKIKATAKYLITVSHNYYKYLEEKEGIAAAGLKTVPCMVDPNAFAFDEEKRIDIRAELNISTETKVGVYLGKFGGIYYDDEAFRLFKASLDYYNGDFFLILLTPTDTTEIYEKLARVAFPKEKTWVGVVPHAKVPDYLSAADFAYNLHAAGPTRIALSPIKNGEYWANGLPILIADGIGDDSDIIKQEGGGAIMDINQASSIQKALQTIDLIIKDQNAREKIKDIALKHRNFKIGAAVYQAIVPVKR